MIYGRIIRNEVRRKLGSLTVVFAFFFLSALLVASATSLIVELGSSLDRFFDQAETPDFVQMHAGEIDRSAIENWGESHPSVSDTQIVEMITIDGSSLILPGVDAPETNSVMDISFVVQNPDFDYLLDSGNAIAQVEPGTVGVPIYYVEERGVNIGDVITLSAGTFAQDYTVGAVIRDSQMNPAIVHSKRFLVHPEDYTRLRSHFPDTEYLIEFRLTAPEQIDSLTADYEAAELPSLGPLVDQQLLKLLNGLSDGIVAAVIIILSFLLMIIAILCLRFTILATVEEDYREIGAMKAIGMPKNRIRGIYLLKYIALGGGATAAGYLASIPVAGLLTTNISRYIGRFPSGAARFAIPAAAAFLVFLLVYISAAIVLRRFNRISAVEALRAGAQTDAPRPGRAFGVSRVKWLDLTIFLGIRDALLRIRLFGLLILIFFFSAVVTLMPVHFHSTMSSPEFISYMGIGRSDLRIDLRQTGEAEGRFDEVVSAVAADREVERHVVMVTSRFTLLRENGESERLAVETGDFTLFPLDYLRGRAPDGGDEIALSYLNSRELQKDIGETLTLVVGGAPRELTVVGIYQDITNGGRTAKATFPPNNDSVVAETISLDLVPGAAKEAKAAQYSELFHPARVTDLERYLSQTLGTTLSQLAKVTLGAILVGVAISILIAALFLKMLIAKDARRVAIMRALGFSLERIRAQYLTTTLLLLAVGIGLGVLFSNTLGQSLVSVLWSFMGAARIEFVTDPLRAYVIAPALLVSAVAITTMASVKEIKDQNITATIAE